MKGNYGIRKCLHCGKEFEATYCSQVTCSKECRQKRLNLQKKQKTSIEILWETVEWLNCMVEACKHNKPPVAIAPEKSRSERLAEQKAKKATKESPATQRYRHICTHCGSTFYSKYMEDSFCSKECGIQAGLGIIN